MNCVGRLAQRLERSVYTRKVEGSNPSVPTKWRITLSGDVVQLVRTLPCHGRGREFESRRPRHSFQKSCTDFDDTIENPEGTFRALFVSLYLIAREPVIRMSTNLLALCCQSGLDDM